MRLTEIQLASSHPELYQEPIVVLKSEHADAELRMSDIPCCLAHACRVFKMLLDPRRI